MKFKRLTALLVSFLLCFQVSSLAFSIPAKNACVLDFETGKVIYEKDSEVLKAPASMTKVMTLFILFEGLEKGIYTKETLIPVSKNAADLSVSGGTSNIPLKMYDKYSIEELINAMAVRSACACCTLFGEFFSGSEANFASYMTKRATELGLNAYFEDASGLSNNNRISARSMAELTRLFIKKYPDILNYTKKPSVVIRGKKYFNTNQFLKETSSHYLPFIDGFKTGTTSLAGKCITVTGSKDDVRIISVSMGSQTNDERYVSSEALIDYGFPEAVNIKHLESVVFSTDIKTYINENEIPCVYFHGTNPSLLIKAEDLSSYGFTASYVKEENTLYIYPELNKKVVPVKSDDTKIPGKELYSLYKESVPRVMIKSGNTYVPFKTVYSLNGSCLISVDELSHFIPYTWDNEKREAHFTFINEEETQQNNESESSENQEVNSKKDETSPEASEKESLSKDSKDESTLNENASDKAA